MGKGYPVICGVFPQGIHGNSNHDTNPSLHILSNSLFTHHLTIGS
jgi:hypothetical protein